MECLFGWNSCARPGQEGATTGTKEMPQHIKKSMRTKPYCILLTINDRSTAWDTPPSPGAPVVRKFLHFHPRPNPLSPRPVHTKETLPPPARLASSSVQYSTCTSSVLHKRNPLRRPVRHAYQCTKHTSTPLFSGNSPLQPGGG